ncbi:major facilitator superfamily domain-containing protein [Sporodiniella umbellata]|nr:major facilitator superfamily domain-containing protein [Sporodiniella umbellata]
MPQETSPLLSKTISVNYDSGNDSNREETITIYTSRSSVSDESDTPTMPATLDDEILEKRLNGAPLYAILSGLWIGVVLSSLDASIVAAIYPRIGTEFKKSNEIIWIATSYMLSYTALQPLYGRISDVFGRKSAVLFSSIVFFIGSLLCGMSNNLWELVVARAIAGIGGGGINCMTTVVGADLVPLRERGKIQGYGNIAFSVGSVVGAPLGGFLTDIFGWRSCFYINLPFLLVTLYVSASYLTNYNLTKEQLAEPLSQKLKKIDYAGAVTIVLAVVSFVVATSIGGNTKPWSDVTVVSFLVASVVLSILFCIVEAKFAANPIMPWSIASRQTSFACSMTSFWSMTCHTALVYLTPLYFQAVLGFSPSTTGLYALPKAGALPFGSVLAGVYMSRTGEYKNFAMISNILAIISALAYSTWSAETSLISYILFPILDGLSVGSIIVFILIAMHSSVGNSVIDMAVVTSMTYLFRSIGGVVGISASSSIFQGVVKSILVQKIQGPDAELYIDIARKSMTEVRGVLPADVLSIVIEAYQVGYQYTCYACLCFATCALISTVFIERYDLATKTKK